VEVATNKWAVSKASAAGVPVIVRTGLAVAFVDSPETVNVETLPAVSKTHRKLELQAKSKGDLSGVFETEGRLENISA
jgi:hypothetical protein